MFFGVKESNILSSVECNLIKNKKSLQKALDLLEKTVPYSKLTQKFFIILQT